MPASCARVLSHESGCAPQALPVTRAVAVVGPAQEALSYIIQAPADLCCSRHGSTEGQIRRTAHQGG